MKNKEKIITGQAMVMSVALPVHLYRRIKRKARLEKIGLSKFIRDILSDHFNYRTVQYRDGLTNKLYLNRIRDEKNLN